MISTRTITVPAGASTAELNGLDSGLLRSLRPDRMPYLVSMRIVIPTAHPVWRVDGTRMGGMVQGTWWNWATSQLATLILPPLTPGSPISDWQQEHLFPGIPLADGGDECGSEWISNTSLRFTSGAVAVATYEVTIIMNIVQHLNLVT